jgi:iron complex outermembrane receptor protein
MKKNLNYYGLFKPYGNWQKLLMIMKITVFLLFTAMLNLTALPGYAQNTKISLEMKDATVESILSKIEDESEFFFLFNQKLIDVDRRIDIHAKNESIKNILNDIFSDDVRFIVSDRQIVLSPADDSYNLAERFQQVTVSGKVRDAATGEPMPGVNIVVKGTGIGSSTNADGSFSISATSSNATLVFTFIGYAMQEIPLNGATTLEVIMSSDMKGLQEVVVTALNIRRDERELGYSMAQIKGAELAVASQVNPVNTLQGKTAGVNVSTTSGGTFGGSRINIRGNSTFGANTQPIFVIDGVVMDNDLSGVGGSDWGNQLKNLNSDDYESISILKGAAATALYGSRAIHGVVLVTTKSGGQESGIGVEINQTVGVRYAYAGPAFQNEYGAGNTAGWFSFVDNGPNTRLRDDKHDVTQFFAYDLTTNLPSMAFNSWEELSASWGPKFDGQEIIDYDGSRALWVPQPNNYLDFYDTGITRKTNVAISGGSEKNTFRMSFSNMKETGVIPRNDFGKNSFSIKGDQDLIKDRLKVGGLVHYTRSLAENPVTGATSGAVWFHDAFARNYDVNKWRNNYKDIDGGVPYPASDAYNYTRLSRIWMEVNDNENYRTEGSLVAKANIDFTITNDLKGTIEGSINQFTWTGENLYRATDINRLNGAYGMNNGEKFQHSYAAKLFYQKQVTEDFHFDAIAGAELWNSQTVYSTASTNGGFKVRDFYAISNSKYSPNANAGINYNKQIQSIYGYFNLAYKQDVYLNTTFRRDWSSALIYPDGSGDPGFTYPSVSLSWVVNETFVLPAFISFAKYRASYAVVGNDTDPYLLSTGFSPDNFSANSNLTMFRLQNNTAISPTLVAEKKHSFETGIDLRLFNNRMTLDMAYYQDNNKNQIISLPVPQESGITSTLINAGNMENKGIEITAGFSVIENQNFSWDVSFNYTHNRDKIIELAPGINEFLLYGNPSDANSGTASYAYVGGNYGDLVTRKGYKYYDGENTDNHGIPILWDRNGWSVAYMPGIANMDSLLVMGNMQPDWYGGMTNTLRYKRFRLNMIVDARIGGEIYSSDARYGMHQGVLEMSLENRDAEHGGITWVSSGQGQNVYGKTYYDGYIPEGVFPDGTMITYGSPADRQQVDVGGMTYQEAFDQGLVEPTHWSGFVYRHTSASTGTPLTGVFEQSWIALRELSLSYSVPRSMLRKFFIKDATVSVTGRDLGYFYNSMPDNINPVIENNVASNPLQMGNMPFIRSITFDLNLKF